ncbi:MAG: chromosome partitioning protein ParA [Candidatus Margulisiibacteriota bacterium]|nr:MAG: chromosome partitioning protein ParA [Candidatus Margulisbacteria bacterium GWD2_39_127]OGI11474.1 MAG: chromosome partitioning protein ParA [Candidatus Margulisbacteria bacterium GWE2_39_32]PZM81941.1 MAG: chromosome partitioning protein ParA [Candidatus Margulisiibacteriota bacterium]HAR63706.1 chromosome partitioning protein ParA [Candidatus Margulisiibacteriota bacterium]HCY37312.1 chromosome partitioning protein ParA [Candidatus Margulisiibacteriota bacterium]
MKEKQNEVMQAQQLKEKIAKIKNKIVVLSGKGGVGKSTVAISIARALAKAGQRIGILDVDIHGPSIPNLLGIKDEKLTTINNSILPYVSGDNLLVISIGLLLDNSDQPVIWRGPAKMSMIKQFVQDVEWGELDYLVVDCPPGTGDEPLSIMQMLGEISGAVIVTTPQELALVDVRKSVNFCKMLHVPVAGVVENMSGFVCPDCNKTHYIFKSGGAEKMASEMGIPFLGKIPIDPRIVETGDSGTSFARHYEHTEAGRSIKNIITKIKEFTVDKKEKGEKIMRFAIPTENGVLCSHFGHCEQFTFIDVDDATKAIIKSEGITPPAHEPGVIPRWVAGQGATIVISGGMGAKAKSLFESHGVRVVVGAANESPHLLVGAFLNGTLVTGINACDH